MFLFMNQNVDPFQRIFEAVCWNFMLSLELFWCVSGHVYVSVLYSFRDVLGRTDLGMIIYVIGHYSDLMRKEQGQVGI